MGPRVCLCQLNRSGLPWGVTMHAARLRRVTTCWEESHDISLQRDLLLQTPFPRLTSAKEAVHGVGVVQL